MRLVLATLVHAFPIFVIPKTRNALVLCLIFAAFPVLAEDQPTAVSDGWKDELTKRCARRVNHVPRADVEYKPGTAAGGWAVQSPNLNEPLNIDPSKIKAPLDLPLGNYVSNQKAYNVDFSQIRMNVGTLTMQDGKLLLDGQPLNPDDPRMADVCDSLPK